MTINKAFSVGKALMFKTPLALSLIAVSLMVSSIAFASQGNRIEQYFQSDHVPTSPENYSIIRQNGSHNRTTVSQSYSAQYQNGNFSSIQQTGNFNTASITQLGGNNAGLISQNGDRHSAVIHQAYGRQGLEAFVTQTGNQSDIAISQSGSGYRSISVEQQAFSGSARPVTVETY